MDAHSVDTHGMDIHDVDMQGVDVCKKTITSLPSSITFLRDAKFKGQLPIFLLLSLKFYAIYKSHEYNFKLTLSTTP